MTTPTETIEELRARHEILRDKMFAAQEFEKKARDEWHVVYTALQDREAREKMRAEIIAEINAAQPD